MPSFFQRFWQRLRNSLWFVPSVLVLGACALAYGLIEFDRRTSFDGAKQFPLLFGVGAQGSRSMLTAVAGSLLTVAALIYLLHHIAELLQTDTILQRISRQSRDVVDALFPEALLAWAIEHS